MPVVHAFTTSPRHAVDHDTNATPPPTVEPGPPGSWEELFHRQLRLRRMAELLIQGYSYRRIAKELGVARSTVMRMAPEVAKLSDAGAVVLQHYLGLHEQGIDPTHDDVATEADIDNERAAATHNLIARAAER